MPLAARIVAAGAVVSRKAPGPAGRRSLEVLLVHRPKYDDWSFPKGKLDPHEHPTVAAVREVAEETGVDIRLGPPLGVQTYTVRNGRTRTKDVHYWVGRLVGNDEVDQYSPNEEIDQVAWFELDKARRRLTYPRDRDTLEAFLRYRKRSVPLVVARHTKARSRRSWRGDDRERPLTKSGDFQAEQLVPILGAYGVSRVVTSSSRRCRATVEPYADVAGVEVQDTDDLAEEEATPAGVRSVVTGVLAAQEPTVLCTHRPVLPLVCKVLGVDPGPLEPGALAVIHHRKGKVLAVEVHTAPNGR